MGYKLNTLIHIYMCNICSLSKKNREQFVNYLKLNPGWILGVPVTYCIGTKYFSVMTDLPRPSASSPVQVQPITGTCFLQPCKPYPLGAKQITAFSRITWASMAEILVLIFPSSVGVCKLYFCRKPDYVILKKYRFVLPQHFYKCLGR